MTHITVPDQTPFVEYVVSGATTVFTFAFTYFDASDLRVTVDGVEQASNTYTVVGTPGFEGGYPGGTVTLNTAVSNCVVQIWSSMPPVRTNDFNEGAGIPAESANTELDRLTARQRDVRLRLQRTPVLTKAISTTLAASDAGQLWTNKNQTAQLTYTLPAASMGLRFEFGVVENFAETVAASGSDTVGGLSSLTCSVVGGYLEIVCADDGIWAVKSKNGTWA